MKQKVRINFVDFWPPNTREGILRNPLYKILSHRFDLELVEKPDFLLYSNVGKRFLKYNCVRIYYEGENIRPNFDECDYSFGYDYPINDRGYRLPLYRLYFSLFDELRRRRLGDDDYPRGERKFCNFLYTKNAQDRTAFFHQLQAYKPVDSGGRLLNNLGYRVEDTLDFMRQYKFSISFENGCYPGYTTEKIEQALVARTVPIYWGNPLIDLDFNPEAFINCHDYDSFEDVIERVREVDANDDLYHAYLEASPFPNNAINDSVKEENILDRFEQIFSNPRTERAAKPIDICRYYAQPLAKRIRKCRKVVGGLLTR